MRSTLTENARKPIVVIAVSVLFLTSLACNYPVKIESTPDVSENELRQTLAAQLLATSQMSIPTETSVQTEVGQTQTLLPSTDTPQPMDVQTQTPDSPLVDRYTGVWANNPSWFPIYFAQSGDTLPTLAIRFDVEPEQITSSRPLPAEAYMAPGQQLNIPTELDETPYPTPLLPDSEIIFSPSAVDFDIQSFITEAGGYLSTYEESVYGEVVTGAEIVSQVAAESSVNPRFLLAFLEIRSHWVLGQPEDAMTAEYPIGFHVAGKRGLYQELVMSATHLNMGYYGWRMGTQTEIKFPGGKRIRISPHLNPGSVAVQHLFSKFYKEDEWRDILYEQDSFSDLYWEMFGDPWSRAEAVEPLLPIGLEQPTMELPFVLGERWSLTGGPHFSWNTNSPRGALDFAPITGEGNCAVSRAWVTASAAGNVVRAAHNVVAIDLDGDGYEQTGWVLVYLHIADKDRITPGGRVNLDDPIGHPSCERGTNTGTHVHIARKYNGEWLLADGPLPFILSGWEVHAGEKNYKGEMRKGDQVVVASPVGPSTSIIVR